MNLLLESGMSTASGLRAGVGFVVDGKIECLIFVYDLRMDRTSFRFLEALPRDQINLQTNEINAVCSTFNLRSLFQNDRRWFR